MNTNLEKLICEFRSLHAEAIRIAGKDHEDSDLNALLKVAGGALEVFLKGHVHVGRKWVLARLISDLDIFGIGANEIQVLDKLRDDYNSAKHDPCFSVTASGVAKTIGDALDVLGSWRGKKIGTTEALATSKYKRTLWLAGWDHYVHGDGEVHIMAPSIEGDRVRPPSIDLIYLKGLAWPTVLDSLGAAVLRPEGLIPEKYLSEWAAEGDFAGARVYQGDFRELIKVLSSEELNLDLIPFLKRENDPNAMFNAVALAFVDVLPGLLTELDVGQHPEIILRQAALEYATPPGSRLARRFADGFSGFWLKVPSDLRRPLSGPRFVSPTKFQQLSTIASYVDDDLLITQVGELVIEF